MAKLKDIARILLGGAIAIGAIALSLSGRDKTDYEDIQRKFVPKDERDDNDDDSEVPYCPNCYSDLEHISASAYICPCCGTNVTYNPKKKIFDWCVPLDDDEDEDDDAPTHCEDCGTKLRSLSDTLLVCPDCGCEYEFQDGEWVCYSADDDDTGCSYEGRPRCCTGCGSDMWPDCQYSCKLFDD